MYTAQGKIDRSQAVEQYLPLVRRHALSLQVRLPSSVELGDLIQANWHRLNTYPPEGSSGVHWGPFYR